MSESEVRRAGAKRWTRRCRIEALHRRLAQENRRLRGLLAAGCSLAEAERVLRQEMAEEERACA